MKLIRHGSSGVYCYYRGCTAYADFRHIGADSTIRRLAIDNNLTATHFYLYVVCGEIPISDNDKFMFAKDDMFKPYILRDDGSVLNFFLPEKLGETRIGTYFFDNEKNQNTIQKMIQQCKENGCSDEECMLTYIQNHIDDCLSRSIVYYGEKLFLGRLGNIPMLWSDTISTCLPHVEHIGGYPNERYIFIYNLTDYDYKHMQLLNGETLNAQKLMKLYEKLFNIKFD